MKLARLKTYIKTCIEIPAFWLLWGFIGYPIASLFCGLLSFWVALQYGFVLDYSLIGAVFGWVPSVIAGVLLGITTAYSAMCWQDAWFSAARGVAFWGALFIGGGWLLFVGAMSTQDCVACFGYFTPPLVWSIGLILFAIVVRVDPRD